jgi:hypothetical protein
MSEASTCDNPLPAEVETVVLIRDLLFSSKVSAAARLSRVREAVRIVRDPAKLSDLEGQRLIVDLNVPGHLEAAVAWKTRTGGVVIGFVSHVDGDAIAAARAMGVDRVMSNGGFSANVDQIIRGE